MSWAPPNETASEIWNERSILDGLFLGAVAYGIHLTLFIWTFHLLWSRKRTKQDYFFLLYISILFALGNIGNATNIKSGEMTFIDDRNYPGGPNAYFVEQSTNPIVVVCNTVYIVNSWFQDGLLLYRLWVISQRTWYIVVIPSLMFLTSFVFSLFLIVELSQPNITLWSTISFNLALPYWSISIALNVIVTAMIGSRLLYTRYRMRNILVGGASYVSITAMLVESAALYTINGLIFLISYATNSPIQNLALPTLGQTQSIAPLLIILRVAQGQAWSKDTMNKLSTLPANFHTRQTDMPLGESVGTISRTHGSSTVLGTFQSHAKTASFENFNGDKHKDF